MSLWLILYRNYINCPVCNVLHLPLLSPHPLSKLFRSWKTKLFSNTLSYCQHPHLTEEWGMYITLCVLNHCNGMSWDSHTDTALHLINNLQIGNETTTFSYILPRIGQIKLWQSLSKEWAAIQKGKDRTMKTNLALSSTPSLNQLYKTVSRNKKSMITQKCKVLAIDFFKYHFSM